MENPSGKPPFSAIFDFSFTEFISIDLIRVLYVFAFVVAGVAMVGAIFCWLFERAGMGYRQHYHGPNRVFYHRLRGQNRS